MKDIQKVSKLRPAGHFPVTMIPGLHPNIKAMLAHTELHMFEHNRGRTVFTQELPKRSNSDFIRA